MPIIIRNNKFYNSGTGIRIEGPLDAHISGNHFENVRKSIEIIDSERATIIRNNGLELRMQGTWAEADIFELLSVIKNNGSRDIISTKTKIGSYLKQKISDPASFTAEISSIASFFGLSWS